MALTTLRRAAALSLAALPVALAGSSSATADVQLASGLPQAPKVSAALGAFAWSVYDGAAGGWQLALRRNGVTQILPVATSAAPFDVDLGSDARGGLVASYSRCSKPAQAPQGPLGFPQPIEMPHGCKLYYYDFAAGAERPIAVANRAGFSQFHPSMAAGRVAFARVDDRRPAGAGNRVQLYVQSLTGGSPMRLPGGMQDNVPSTGPSALDLSATALAFSWDMGSGNYSLSGSSVDVDRLAGGQTVVAVTYNEHIEGKELVAPTLYAGAVRYGLASWGDEPLYQLRSLTLPGGHAGSAAAPGGLASVATGPGGTIYSRCSTNAYGQPTGPPCEVALVEHVAYDDPDAQLAHPRRPTPIATSPQQTVEDSPGHVPGNWLAWSAYDAIRRRYRLMLREPSGKSVVAPVPPRPVPFDVQLGPRAGGGLIAVYSRCRVEPRLDPRDLLPLYSTGRGCRLYRYDIGSSAERPIPGSGSRFLPSVWNGRLAYAALRPDGRPALYLGSLSGHGTARRLPAGALGGTAGLGPRAVALRQGRVAFVWERRTGSALHSELHLDAGGAHLLLLDSVTSRFGQQRELSPAFTGDVLAWARREAGGRSEIRVYGLSSRRVSAFLAPDPIEALATNGLGVAHGRAEGDLFYVRGERGASSIRQLVATLRDLPIEL